MTGISLQDFFPLEISLQDILFVKSPIPQPPPPPYLKSQIVNPLEFGSSYEKFDDWPRPLSGKQYLFFHVQIGKRGKVQHLRANCVHEFFYNPAY